MSRFKDAYDRLKEKEPIPVIHEEKKTAFDPVMAFLLLAIVTLGFCAFLSSIGWPLGQENKVEGKR